MAESRLNYLRMWCLVLILICNQLFVPVVANPVSVTCHIPSVELGDSVKLQCSFGSALTQQNTYEIYIKRWPSSSADPEDIVHCFYTVADGTVNCTQGQITCDPKQCVTEFVANKSSEGDYACMVLPVISSKDYQKCPFRPKIGNSTTGTTVSPVQITSAPNTSKETAVPTSATTVTTTNASSAELQNTSAALSPGGIAAVVLGILLVIVLVAVAVEVFRKYKDTVRQRCPFFKTKSRNDDANNDQEAHNMISDDLVEERNEDDVSLTTPLQQPSQVSDRDNEHGAMEAPTVLLSEIRTQLSEERDQETDGAQGSDMNNPSGITSGAVGEGDGAERDTRGANRAPNTPSTTKKTTFTASDAQCQNPTQVQNETEQRPTDLRIPTQAQTPTDLHSPIQAQSPTQAQGLTFHTPTDLQNPTPSQQQRYQNDSAASCSESSAYDCCSKAEKVEFGKPDESWLQAVEEVFCSKNYGKSKSEIEELQRQNNDLLFDLQKHTEFIDARKGEGADCLKQLILLIQLGERRSEDLNEELKLVRHSDARNSATDRMIDRYRSQTSLTERHHRDRLNTSTGSEVPIDIHAKEEPYEHFEQNAPRASTPSDELDMKKFKVKAQPAEDSHVSAVHSNGLRNCTMSDSITADTICTADSALNESSTENCNSVEKFEITPASDSSRCIPVVSMDSNQKVKSIQVKGAGIPFTKAVSVALASANDTESKQRKLTEEEVKKEIEQEVENYPAEYESCPAFLELRRNLDNILQQTEYSDEMFDLLIQCLCNALKTLCIVLQVKSGGGIDSFERSPTPKPEHRGSPICLSVLKVADNFRFLRPALRQL